MAGIVYTSGVPGAAPDYYALRGYNLETGDAVVSITHTYNIYGLAVDGQGNLLFGNADSSGGYNIFKYTNSGSEIWKKQHSNRVIWAVATDKAGNSYFAGEKTTTSITTRKFNAAGTEQWTANHDATVYAIAVDASGNVYTVGDVSGGSVTTRKYNSSGTEQWTANHGATVRAIAVDSSGNVYTYGHSVSGYHLRKYNSSGTLQWSADTGGTGYGIALDSDGNCYVCLYDGYVKKFNASGTEITTGGFPITIAMTLRAIKVDQFGDIFVGGGVSYGKTLIKLNSSGVEQWRKNHGATVVGLALYEAVVAPGLSMGVALGTPVSVVSTMVPALSLPLVLALPITPSSHPEPLDIHTLPPGATLIYRCYVGSATGAFLEYPFRALQCRRRRNDSTWLNVELPGVTPTQAATLLNCVDHALVIYVGMRQKDVETRGEFLYAVVTSVEYEQAPFRSVARLTGRVAAVNETLQTRALLGVTSVQNEDGRERVRCACIDYRLRPGDTVTVGTTSFVAYRVAYQIAPAQQWMEVEAEPL